MHSALHAFLLHAVLAATPTCDANQIKTASSLLLEHEHKWRIKTEPVSAGTQVFAIDGFLPPKLADEWYETLNATWERSLPCRSDPSACVSGGHDEDAHGGGLCSWLYTTNSHGSNAKVRSVFRRHERKREVHDMYRRGNFAYSKWELTAGHSLYASMGEMMSTDAVRDAVSRAVRMEGNLGNISDYFVTAFDDGDFLSTHSDGASGSLAWVLHLSAGTWDSSAGGELRFNAGPPPGRSFGQRDFAPSFNRLLLFLTRPDYVPHQVLPVKLPSADHPPRFGMTGWYMTKTDHFSAATQRENDAMRAAASKASVGDVCL
jgi:hypothetical protein